MADVGEKSSATRSSAALESLALDAPVHELTRPRVDEWAVRRMWEGVQRRRALPVQRERPYVVALAAFAAVAAVLALVIAGVQLVRSPAEPARADLAAPPGRAEPLLTTEARRFEVLEAPLAPANPAAPSATGGVSRATARVDFADGSSIEASPGARVEALASRPGEFAVAVRRGRAQFRVTPGGPRRWRIEASNAQVEVLGTVLWVESDAAGSSVRVDVGRVLVRSPELPGGSRPLAAGEVLRLGAPLAALEPAPETGAAEVAPGDPELRPDAAVSPATPAAPVERRRARAQALGATRLERGAAASLPARRPRGSTAAALWEEADEARREGEPARAAELLARLIDGYPEDSQVALAAFTLGVLQLDRLARPVDAAESFQLALELGIGAALRDDAYLRWAEALSQVRDTARLAMVSAEYARLYPGGRQRAAIERLAQAAARTAGKRRAPNGGVAPSTSEDP
jgi:ferric-dicitrate binding protein FerR (iron transport regulator)